MKVGKTSTGFEFTFDPAAADDMRIVDMLAVVVNPEENYLNTLTAASKLTELLLGAEQKKALYEHIGARHGGRVPTGELQTALTEIMSASGKDAEKNC